MESVQFAVLHHHVRDLAAATVWIRRTTAYDAYLHALRRRTDRVETAVSVPTSSVRHCKARREGMDMGMRLKVRREIDLTAGQ